jgi:hypothetical protein
VLCVCTDRYRGRYLIIAGILSLLQIFLLFIIRSWRLFLHFQTQATSRSARKKETFFVVLFRQSCLLVVWFGLKLPPLLSPTQSRRQSSLSHCRLFSSWCVKGLTVSRVKSSGAYGHKIQIQKKSFVFIFFFVFVLAGS